MPQGNVDAGNAVVASQRGPRTEAGAGHDSRPADAPLAEHHSLAQEAANAIPGGRRRIDRVLGEGFAEHLEELAMPELRARRKDAEQEETDLSFLRRLIQGRLDLVHAEVERRGGAPQKDLVSSLTDILSEGSTRGSNSHARYLPMEPSRLDERRRYVEKVVADVDLSNATSLTEEQLDLAVIKLNELEADISHDRRLVQQVMDACTAEIGRRYREGNASVDDLLQPRG